jgi:cytochrome b involved in lipid metabolism
MGEAGLKDDLSLAGGGMPPGRPAAAQEPAGGHSAGEVAGHNSEGSCWLIIHGNIYDVTKFIPFHPGGSAILEGCGKDATGLFETRPMGSGAPHSSYARKTAAGYYAGRVR